MKLLFVHDHPFRRVDGKLYSTGGLNDLVLQRYTKYCEELTIIARIYDEITVNNRWSLITNPKVNIFGNKTIIVPELKDEIERCDKMIVRLPSMIGIQALDINKTFKKPYFIEMVGCAWDALWNHGTIGKMIAPFIFLRNKQLIKNAPYVLYVTQAFLQDRYPSFGRTIGCSDVEITNLNGRTEERRLEKIKSQTNKSILRIGTIAAIDVPYKGQEYVIRALGELKKRGDCRYEYHIVGNGNSTRLKKIAKECDVETQVYILGGIPHEKVFDWLDSIDLYIQPSKQEGLPRALVEAMSRGLPALGTTAGGIPELISEKCLFGKGDYFALANILEKLDIKELIQMSHENFDVAQKYQKSELDQKRDAFYRMFMKM